ncbi:MAG: diaminopimelate epimerase [Acidimicrobiales bacterium]
MRLAKYHGLGNDFLVVVDRDGTSPIDAELARALCHRHTGVGADGLVRVTPGGPGGADVTMELRNADGSRAETSGNGLRCLARAVVDAGLVVGPNVVVATDAGLRRATLGDDGAVTVEMGIPRFGPDGADVEGRRAAAVDLGNPHLVVLADGWTAELVAVAVARSSVPEGPVNVELVAPGPGPDELEMRVWERGVGETAACGSGACAAAAAAHEWKLVGGRVTVRQPGGAATVDLSGDVVLLTGSAAYVATVEVPGVAGTEPGPEGRR